MGEHLQARKYLIKKVHGNDDTVEGDRAEWAGEIAFQRHQLQYMDKDNKHGREDDEKEAESQLKHKEDGESGIRD